MFAEMMNFNTHIRKYIAIITTSINLPFKANRDNLTIGLLVATLIAFAVELVSMMVLAIVMYTSKYAL